MKYKNIVFLIFSLVTSLGLNAQSGNKDYTDAPLPNTGPNIIFIYVDDLGYGDLGNFWQNQKEGDRKMVTPHLDALANEGAILTHHYTSAPVCAPARASLLEGLHQGHSSVRDNQFDKPIKAGLTMAEMLQKSGYRTLHVGKAGLAGKRGETEPDPKTLPAHPLKRGFDQFYGYLYHIQGHQHYPQNGTTNQRAYFTNGYTNVLTGTDLTYTTDVYTAKSKQWITLHENTRPEQPFFLYLAYDSPHAALQVPTQAYPKGGGLHGGLQWTSESSQTPWVNTASGTRDTFIHPDYDNKDWNETAKRHATMIRRIDNAVADLIQLLKDLNIDDNTLIVFSTDNGPHHEAGSGGRYKQDPQFFQSYANMNGTKRDMWEAGIRVPTICRYPGVIPEQSEVTFPSGQWDWLATFADVAHVAIPQYTDGVSLMPSLTKNNKHQIDKGYTYHEYGVGGTTQAYEDFETSKRNRHRGQMQVIRMGDYKGVRYDVKDHGTTLFEIYNVVTDEREHFNLADAMPELQRNMKEKVLQVRKSNPTAARPYDSELIPGKTLVSPIKGLKKSIFSGKHQWVPNFEYLSPQSTAIVSGIDTSTKLSSEFGLFYTGYIKIPEDGLYTFYLESGSKSHIMLHDIHLLDNDYIHTTEELSAQVYLKSGFHPIRISYQQNTMGEPSISLKLEGPNRDKALIPSNMFFVEKTKTE
ncbi:sulfatase-like hydrolase/transferase [Aestuariivivens insulae]|uniref:sulfatase-like hydrolase/transferase n=1 Tax=Aestuariivivens insulae TaxID=1621988 RepID=UPI001F5925B0|nr:sulfatase-like hydrolase/transferase [Aestuariivivens insulae]